MYGFKACQLGCAGSPCVTCMYVCMVVYMVMYGYVWLHGCIDMYGWLSDWVSACMYVWLYVYMVMYVWMIELVSE